MNTTATNKFWISALTTLLLTATGAVRAGEFTDVIDAFDEDNGDPFDINLKVGYQRREEKGTITRETHNNEQALVNGGDLLHQWDYYAKYKFGEYQWAQNLLNIQLDIGIYHDLAFRLTLPIILSDERSLTAASNPWRGATPLFSAGFTSPQRHGLDYVGAGFWWNILDQSRTAEHPTLTGFIEGRFSVGDPLRASCASASDTTATNCTDNGGGISENVHQLHLGAKFSRRYGIVEPYMGIDALLGWYKDKDFTMQAGALNDLPPLRGTFDFGIELIPWEVPAKERKFVIALGGGATYVSEGRAYTPLFDALGTSAYFARNADIDDSGTTGDIPEETAALAAWNGMTDVENYGIFFGRLDLVLQPAKYVKFATALQMGHVSEHFITKTDQCPAGAVKNNVCTEYNPGHRPEIDEPGTRFRVEKTFIWSLFLDVTAQF